MDLVWEQHIMWTRIFLISVAENLADLEPTKARLLENPKDIANVFKRYYGTNIANTIEKLLTEHLVIGGDLIVALKNGNQKLADELNKKWYVSARLKKDYAADIKAFDMVQKEILKMSKFFVDGIVNQFPYSF